MNEITIETRWQVGDVLYRAVGGSFPHVFIAKHLPDSADFGEGCYSTRDRGETRKATFADVLRCVEMQCERVQREWQSLNNLLAMLRKCGGP